MNKVIEELKNKLKGYHFEIQIYPTGGFIEATGCDECGTNDSVFESASWGINRKIKTIDDAVVALTKKLTL